MENASKALIIAGAILLSILIIALGIYVFNMARGVINTNQLSELEVSQFNQKFTNYRGKRLGSAVKSLIDILVSNATNNKDSDERLPDIVYLDKKAGVNLGDLSSIGGDSTGTVSKNSGNKDNYVISLQTTASVDIANKIKGVISNLGLTYSSYKSHWAIISDRNTSSIDMISRVKTIISDNHFYQVLYNTDDNSGIIDYIFIVY